MSTRNYIEFYRKKLDYHKYQPQIDRFTNKLVHGFTSVYKGITNYRIREAFWNLVDENVLYDPRNWYHVFATFMGKLAMYEILFEEKIISKMHKDIHNEWAGYLAKLLIPHEPMIPNKFFIDLIQNVPVPNYESVLALYEEGIFLFNNENLKKIIYDISIKPQEKILKFKVHFQNLFEVLLAKCSYIDQELSRNGETAHIHSLHEIFQLNNNNERTPPKHIKEMLIVLVHIRNAISHAFKSGIIYFEKKGIRVRDYKSNGEKSFERYFTFEELYDYYYLILLLLMEFELVALMLQLHRVIRELNFSYNKMFKCRICGHQRLVFVHPRRTNVVCDQCKTRHHIINNKKLEI